MSTHEEDQIPIVNGNGTSANGATDSNKVEGQPSKGKIAEFLGFGQSGHSGLGVLGAALFIIGEIAGSGVITLPGALGGTGWVGVLIIAICCFSAGLAGIFLGKAWLIIEDLHPEFKEKKERSPYPMIAMKSVGSKMSTFTKSFMNFQMFGGVVVMLLVSAEFFYTLTTPHLNIKFCEWILIVGAILLPFTFFGSPAEFWPIALLAMSATSVAAVLVIYGALAEHDTTAKPVFTPPTSKSFLSAVGVMMFSVAGSSALPTFQNDMKDRKKFPLSTVIAFVTMFFMYISVAVVGYMTYGNKVQPNIIRNLPDNGLTKGIMVLLLCHLMSAYLIVINPVNLCFEDYFGIPHSFNWKRVVFRTCTVLLTVFVGLTIPLFDKILSFIGAFTTTVMLFILPMLFYYKLCKQTEETDNPVTIPKWLIIVTGTLVTFGFIAGGAATYTAITEIAVTVPCYVNNCVTFS